MVDTIPGPRWRSGYQPLINDPFSCIEAMRRHYGDVVAFTEGLSVFSRTLDCAGCVGVFGAQYTEQVLTNFDVFATPMSLASYEGFPTKLLNLSSGLFSMSGQQHQQRRQMFASLFNKKSVEQYHEVIEAGCVAFLETWTPGSIVQLISEMRRLGLYVLSRILYGSEVVESPEGIGILVQQVLQLRRWYGTANDEEQRTQLKTALIEAGEQLDEVLRSLVKAFRQMPTVQPTSLMARLCAIKDVGGIELAEDELVAHGYVFFLAGWEPIAVSLTWTLLLLSQFPAVRRALAQQIRNISLSQATSLNSAALLDAIIKESMRLLPPNAIMVRVTKQPIELGGCLLPSRSEIILSPYISHRDARCFPRPNEFNPARWQAAQPTPFEYLPFGAGSKYCLGSKLSLHIMKSVLARIFQQFDLVLANDQFVEWKVSVTLMPQNDIQVLVCSGTASLCEQPGKVFGSIHQLLHMH